MDFGSIKDKKGGYLVTFFVLIQFACGVVGGSPLRAQSGHLGILCYNVENLFDTIDNPNMIDEDFTPFGKLSYPSGRFEKKIDGMPSA
jgi:hypothetical protein